MVFPALSIAILALVGYLATIDIGIAGQVGLGLSMVAIILLAKPFEGVSTIRMLAIVLATFTSFRYFWWRATETLPTSSWITMALGVLLLAAEAYGIWIYTSGAFISLRPIERKSVPLPADPASWPTVDVLVPSYEEPWDIVGTTLMAAKAMRWPEGKLRVILCDDGGTEQRRAHHDPVRRAKAEQRHQELKARCAEIGVLYVTRAKNEGAKAGNLNHAMRLLATEGATAEHGPSGQFVAIFDADHAPTADFLERTLGFFLEDEKLSLVQTPHFFITPDPIEKNLETFGSMPGEADMFYGQVQRGLDFWDASFFCGSAAVIRRKALDEVGGIQENTVTEDAHTSLEMHARGWHSAYLPRPLVAGLQPASFASMVRQRVRWTQGMIQIFLLHNPLIKRGLTIAQRLCYVANSGFWFFPFARIAFLLSPVPYLVFGMEIFDATTSTFLAYAGPHLLASVIMTDMINGRWRWPFVSELYELALSVYTFPAVIGTMINPKKPTFAVTAKDEHFDRDFLSPLAKPFLGFLLLLTVSAAIGIWRAAVNPRDLDAITVVIGWNLFNILLLLGAIGAMFELRSRRTSPRVNRNLPVALAVGDRSLVGHMVDASIGGMGIRLDAASAALTAGAAASVSLQDQSGKRIDIPCEIRHRRDDGVHGLRFIDPPLQARQAIVSLVYGSSDSWAEETQRRSQRAGLIRGIFFFLRISLGHGLKALGRAFFAGV